MYLKEKVKLYQRIDQCLRMRVPGCAADMAQRFEISRSTFFRCIDEMKQLGAPIEYDEASGCYYYSKDGKFKFGFLTEKESLTINGGSQSFFKYYISGLNI